MILFDSAGVGRTGAFIALDIAMDYIHAGKDLNVFSIVKKMRKDRCNMIQAEVMR